MWDSSAHQKRKLMPSSEPMDHQKTRWKPTIGGVVTALVLVGLIIGGLLERTEPNSEEQQNTRATVAACWKSARADENPNNDHQAKVAECERLQAAYRKKFENAP